MRVLQAVIPQADIAPETAADVLDASRHAPELSVVIPIFHEEANIVTMLEQLRQRLPTNLEILLVYDLDDDPTLPVVRNVFGESESLRFVKNVVARGPSGALRTGFRQARAPAVLVVMGDHSDDLSQVPEMLRLLGEGADVVCPSRYCRGGAQLRSVASRRKTWLSRMAGRCLRWLAGIPTWDPTNSFKLYRTRVLQDIPLRSCASFSVTLELMAKAHCLGYRIVEVPTVWRDRQHGVTKFSVRRALVGYLPWFGVALLRNRLFHLPAPWYSRLFGCASRPRGPRR